MIRLSAFSDEAGKSVDEQIAALKRNGISLTELRSVDGKNVKDLTEDEAGAIAAKLRENDIALSALGSPMGKADISVDMDEYLSEVRHLCRLAVIFGTDKIRMFSFFNAYDCPEEVIRRLRLMVSVACEYGVTLCHENEKKIFGDTCERVLFIAENVPKLKLVYDPANFLQCGEPAEKTLAALCEKTAYFHIKDVVADTGELVPAGYGDGNIAKLVDMIKGDTILTVEPHLKVFGGYDEIDGEEMKHRFRFNTNAEAFDAAVNAIKKILSECGYIYDEQTGGYVRK